MTPEVYAARRERAREKMHAKGLDGLLVAHAANRYYLSGFELHDSQCNESSGLLLLRPDGDDWLLTDPRYLDAARRLWPEERIHIYRAPKNSDINIFLKGRNMFQLGVEADALSYRTFGALTEGLAVEPLTGLVESLRRYKDAAELELMRASMRLNHEAFAATPGFLVPGRTEKEVAWKLEKFYRERGASELAFDTIVGVNENAALPHAIPGDTRIPEEGLVLVDMGCRLHDYCSDQTRTYWVGGEPSDRFRHVLGMVQEAQEAAMRIMRPGLPVREAYGAAREVFERYGQAQYFTHALGHGIGLETHEGTSLSPVSTDVLEPGMVVSVEPGLYYADWGGVRWEHLVCVTEDGIEVL